MCDPWRVFLFSAPKRMIYDVISLDFFVYSLSWNSFRIFNKILDYFLWHKLKSTHRYVAKVQGDVAINLIFAIPPQFEALRHYFDKFHSQCFLNRPRPSWLLRWATVYRQTKSAIVQSANSCTGKKMVAYARSLVSSLKQSLESV